MADVLDPVELEILRLRDSGQLDPEGARKALLKYYAEKQGVNATTVPEANWGQRLYSGAVKQFAPQIGSALTTGAEALESLGMDVDTQAPKRWAEQKVAEQAPYIQPEIKFKDWTDPGAVAQSTGEMAGGAALNLPTIATQILTKNPITAAAVGLGVLGPSMVGEQLQKQREATGTKNWPLALTAGGINTAIEVGSDLLTWLQPAKAMEKLGLATVAKTGAKVAVAEPAEEVLQDRVTNFFQTLHKGGSIVDAFRALDIKPPEDMTPKGVADYIANSDYAKYFQQMAPGGAIMGTLTGGAQVAENKAARAERLDLLKRARELKLSPSMARTDTKELRDIVAINEEVQRGEKERLPEVKAEPIPTKFTINNIPEEMEVDVPMIRESTGQEVKVKMNARQAYADTLADIDTFEIALKRCL